MASLLDFEQYPDYAMKTNRKGERVREPWASGPSPLSMALMAGGFGMMGDGATEWVGGGGRVWDDIGKGGLLGVQAFGQGHRDLQDLRSDYYTQSRAEEDQLIQNQKFINERKAKQEKLKNFPNLINELKALNDPALTVKIPTLIAMAQGGEESLDTAYNTLYNILGTASSKKWEAPELIEGSLFQKTKNGEWKYITTPSASTKSKAPTGPVIMGRLSDSSADLQQWNAEGRKGLKPTSLDIRRYNTLYREKMRMDQNIITVTDKLGASTQTIEERPIRGILDPTSYAIMSGMKPGEIKAYGIDKKLIDTRKYASEAKRSITEAKDIAKVGLIAQVENSMDQSSFDPTTVSLTQYGQYFTSGFFPSVNDFSKKARSYENMALIGSRMFGYLFSGATVKDDENRAMRQVLYPMPGDTDVDVERKKQFRETVLSLYKTYIHPDVSKKLFKKIIANQKQNKPTEIEEVVEIVKTAKKKPVIQLTNPLDIEAKLDELIPE